MNHSLPSTCESVRGHLNDYLSGETAAPIQNAVSAHLSACERCAAEFQTRRSLKESLKGAVDRSPVPPFLESRIRTALAGKRTQRRSRWMMAPAFGLAAALAIAALTGWIASRQQRPWEMAKQDQNTFIDSLYTQVADVMRIGLGDHLHCAYFRKFPGNAPTAEELISKIGPQYAPLLPAVRAQTPGDTVLLAHQCVFRDRSFIHIVLDNHGKLLSLVITRRQAGESFHESAASLDAGTPGVELYPAKAAQFAISGFEAGNYLAFVISDNSERDNRRLAGNLAPSVTRILANVEG